MDDLENLLATGFRVSGDQTNTDGHHPRFSQYKYNYRSLVEDQKLRQQKALERTKEKKFENLSKLRNLPNTNVEDEEEEDEKDDGGGGGSSYYKERSFGGYYKKNILQEFKIKAMLSEWMLEKPECFEGGWMMLMTPVGKRCIVVASRGGKTEVYNKRGQFMFQFRSHLCTTKQLTTINNVILDCIYSEQTDNFYVLDIISFNLHHLWDSEVEFRWFWMHSKFREELKGCDEYSLTNPHPFLPVHKSECTKEALYEALSAPMESYELDGLLFYHKKGHYEFNISSLVLWLKAYMVEELLSIPVHPCHLNNIPSNYTGFQNHSDKITDEKVQKKEAAMNKNKNNKKKNKDNNNDNNKKNDSNNKGENKNDDNNDDNDEVAMVEETTE